MVGERVFWSFLLLLVTSVDSQALGALGSHSNEAKNPSLNFLGV